MHISKISSIFAPRINNKQMKKYIFLLLVVIIATTFLYAQTPATSGTCGDNLQWTFRSSDSTLIITGTGAMYDGTTSSQNGQPWVQLPIMHIQLPEGLTRIGKGAFCYCRQVKELRIPDSVIEIADGSLNSMVALKKLTLGTNLRKIGNNAVSAVNVDTLIFLGTFDQWCQMDMDGNGGQIRVSQALFIEGQQVMGDFYLPSTVHRVKDGVFLYCPGVTSFHFPASIDTIGQVFGVDNQCDTYYYEGTLEQWCNIVHTDGLRFMNYILYINGDDLSNVILPNTIDKVPAYCFCGVWNIRSVTIPSSIHTVGQSAFRATGLTQVIGAENIRRFENSCFEESHYLRDITISPATQFIDDYAFWVVDSLKGTLRLDSVTYLGQDAFGTTGLDSVFLPDHLSTIGESAFRGCGSLRYIRLPETLTQIPTACFWKDTALHSITLPANTKSLGYGAFYHSGLYELTLPASVDSLADGAIQASHLEHLTVLATTPPVADQYFTGGGNDLIIEVPCEAIGAYRQTTPWNLFSSYTSPQTGQGTFSSANTNYGTISVEQNCQEVTLSAIPEEHYHFVQWTDGETANPYFFTQTSDTAISAIFEIDKYRIAFLNSDSSILWVDSVQYNTMPVYLGPAPIHPVDQDRYRFYGWSSSFARATQDTSYMAIYSDLSIHYQGLCLHALENASFYWRRRSWGDDASILQVSRDGQHWESMNTIWPRTIAAGDSIFLRSHNPSSIFNGQFTTQNGVIEATGSIMSLLDTTLTQTYVPDWAFYGLFSGCKHLYRAPYLPATSLGYGCYGSMFSGCDSLRYIEVGFSDWTNAHGDTFSDDWLQGVAPTGRFVFHNTLPLITDESHIPVGWVPYLNEVPLPDSTFVHIVDDAAYIYWLAVDSADIYLLTRYANNEQISQEWIDTLGMPIEQTLPAPLPVKHRPSAPKVVLQQSSASSPLVIRYYWDNLQKDVHYTYNVTAYKGSTALGTIHGAFILSDGPATSIDEITNVQAPITNKILRDGQLYIMYNGKMYNVQGQVVR